MYIITCHGTLLGIDGSTLIQLRSPDDPRAIRVKQFEGNTLLLDSIDTLPYNLLPDVNAHAISFRTNNLFASAIKASTEVALDRTSAGAWEAFAVISEKDISAYRTSISDVESELRRFSERVTQLIEGNKPVCIYTGCGTIPKREFLNLDITLCAPRFLVESRDQYFLFPFVTSWPVAADCVDYIYDEDFVEHISQLNQWQYLSETRRVLKPGSYHRVNTPDIISAMRRHSDFSRGFQGVYTGEEKWGHIAMLSRWQLKEIAETIGFREVIFTTKDHSVSPFSVPDFRPFKDRDPVSGNIFADLMK